MEVFIYIKVVLLLVINEYNQIESYSFENLR